MGVGNTSGDISWRADYRAWGKTLRVEYPQQTEQAEPVRQPLCFQGQYFDTETGLHYNRFRYFDPDVGRFVSHDPVGLAGGINLYQYAPNPLTWIDPLGLTECSPHKKTTYEGVSRRDALRQAKRDACIPNNQHPYEVSRAKLGDGYGDHVRDKNGIPLQTR